MRKITAALASLLLACCPQSIAKKSGCGQPIPQELSDATWETVPIEYLSQGVIQRYANVRLPSDYSSDKSYPLVLSFHAYYNTPEDMESWDGMSNYVTDGQYILVYPRGSDDNVQDVNLRPPYPPPYNGFSWPMPGWNALGNERAKSTCERDREAWGMYPCYESCRKLHGCRNITTPYGARLFASGCSSSSCLNDTRAVEVLLDTLHGMLCIAPGRVHVTGQSDGAMMAIALGLAMPERIASVVAVSAAPLAGAHLDLLAAVRNVSIMSLRGDLDNVIPANLSQGHDGRPPNVSTNSYSYYNDYYHTTGYSYYDTLRTSSNISWTGQRTTPIPTPVEDLILRNSASLRAGPPDHSCNGSTIRTGDPYTHGGVVVDHIISAPAHAIDAVSLSFRYASGYTPGYPAPAPTPSPFPAPFPSPSPAPSPGGGCPCFYCNGSTCPAGPDSCQYCGPAGAISCPTPTSDGCYTSNGQACHCTGPAAPPVPCRVFQGAVSLQRPTAGVDAFVTGWGSGVFKRHNSTACSDDATSAVYSGKDSLSQCRARCREQQCTCFDFRTHREPQAATVQVVLLDARDWSRVVHVLYTSPPLDRYTLDNFTGYSPPIHVKAGPGLNISTARQPLVLALQVSNRGRALRLPVDRGGFGAHITWASTPGTDPGGGNHHACAGPYPHSVRSKDGFFYLRQKHFMTQWARNCTGKHTRYRTGYDGRNRLWCHHVRGHSCANGIQVVDCVFHGSHCLPFNDLDCSWAPQEAQDDMWWPKMIWNFMKKQV